MHPLLSSGPWADQRIERTNGQETRLQILYTPATLAEDHEARP
jgi:hypothetical protein